MDYDNLPAEKIREHFDGLSADEQTKAAQVQCVIDLAAFLQEYADEYEDSVENGEKMRLGLKTRYALDDPRRANFYQLADVFNRLVETGEMKPKASAVKKQVEQAVANRVQQIHRERGPHFDSWEAYNELSLEEVRQRADDQLSGIRRSASRDPVGSMGAEYGETVKPFDGTRPLEDTSRHLSPGASLNRRAWSETPSRF